MPRLRVQPPFATAACLLILALVGPAQATSIELMIPKEANKLERFAASELERYIKRLEKLEGLANSFSGIKQAYAIQAGREIRVLADASKMDDSTAMKTAREIAEKIEHEMQYPGEIKVTLMREVRCVEYAR